MKRALLGLAVLTLAGCFNWDEGVKNCTRENGCLKQVDGPGPGPGTPPGSPTAVIATAGNNMANLAWTAPADPGSSAILGYRVTSAPDGFTTTTTGATQAVVTGPVLGRSYTFTVIAFNATGDGTASEPSNALTIISAPAAPGSVMAVAQSQQATVSWSAPLAGGSPITGFTVTSEPGGYTASSTGTNAVVMNLSNGASYTFTVKATNAVGEGPATAASNAVTPATIPAAPTSVIATRGNVQASVQWTPPTESGGSVITGYTVTSSPGGLTATTSGLVAVVSGLTNATAYTFTVKATNAVGEGPPSLPSNSVTPAAVPGAPTAVSASSGNAQVTVQWTAPTNTGGSAITGYVVTSAPGGFTASTTGATTATVTGLAMHDVHLRRDRDELGGRQPDLGSLESRVGDRQSQRADFGHGQRRRQRHRPGGVDRASQHRLQHHHGLHSDLFPRWLYRQHHGPGDHGHFEWPDDRPELHLHGQGDERRR